MSKLTFTSWGIMITGKLWSISQSISWTSCRNFHKLRHFLPFVFIESIGLSFAISQYEKCTQLLHHFLIHHREKDGLNRKSLWIWFTLIILLNYNHAGATDLRFENISYCKLKRFLNMECKIQQYGVEYMNATLKKKSR